MRIKLDENLPAELADDLRALGHDTDSVVSEGLGGEPDTAVAAAARRAERVLLTLDKGLADMRRFPPQRHAGIVLFRLSKVGRSAVRKIVASRVADLPPEKSVRGRLLVVTESSLRSRR